jgi:hypothetical protein
MTTSYRGFTRSRRLGRDEENELQELIDDPDSGFADVLAAAIAASASDPEKTQEMHEALREVASDGRGPHAWARDRLEMRRHARDTSRHGRDRRLGRDFGPENMTEPGGGRSIERFANEREYRNEEGEDRRHAHDLAMDAKARRDPGGFGSFARRYPNAARIERA